MSKPKSGTNRTDQHAGNKDDRRTQSRPDPREELDLEPPTKKPKDAREREEAKGQKATRFDGSPIPQSAPSTAFKPKDDTPMKLKKSKESPNDQS
ncbi:hypothetical protein L1889_07040 [Paenalcaligenes niemegkensis]|uniref:hypothetical protein n=1 Tax=Paenalcaligenes niemegkensis TaxID=2895469 RepID=UPI001EE939A7|nr:hypothetical protein [Paenalcaligenes niemegkensis]MCQ9616494.1 hypothetical protein [Paenalcaligenes niemegkensis]